MKFIGQRAEALELDRVFHPREPIQRAHTARRRIHDDERGEIVGAGPVDTDHIAVPGERYILPTRLDRLEHAAEDSAGILNELRPVLLQERALGELALRRGDLIRRQIRIGRRGKLPRSPRDIITGGVVLAPPIERVEVVERSRG